MSLIQGQPYWNLFFFFQTSMSLIPRQPYWNLFFIIIIIMFQEPSVKDTKIVLQLKL